jgi:hypothetical protein
MRRPTKSEYHGIRFEITYPEDVKDDKDEEVMGITDFTRTTIKIRDGQQHEREREVLIHEVFHQMFEMSGIHFRKDQEEQVVSYIGGCLLSHLRDNPTFWRYIMIRPPKDTSDEDAEPSA